MSIGWLQPAMGIVFIVVWLISAQIVVAERGTRRIDDAPRGPRAGNGPPSPTMQTP